ncbi:DNA-directed RNA polymerase [Neorhizobium sp. S3-V5DH]|uniref:DNA-directed RNA polymerase n=1 Tax=Neorhizobium sp. S3-V5DH TaxID=2485166 RepID=UPI0010454AAC|nr:DNA-directed RNA polymerase [Neorhizobium sp. S3-V5DH]TCV62335.1 DNA-directed RNA polymerase [Neorhizobium sp. S3-V5DH]
MPIYGGRVTIHPDVFQRQIELEIDMSNLGAARYQARSAREIEQDRGGETQPGQFLIKKAVAAVSDTLQIFIDEVYSGRPGPKAVAARLVRDMDPDAVAYISLKAILGRLMSKSITNLTGLSMNVANALENEARFERFAVLNPGMFARLDKSLTEDGANEAHRRKVLIYAMGKYNIPWERWGRNDSVLLGSKMVELVADATGLIEFALNQTGFGGQYKDQHQVFLTAKASDWVNSSLLRGELLNPYYMPTIIPPKNWTGIVGGGYHSDAVRPVSLVRKARRVHLDMLASTDLTNVFLGLNAIQQTPWQINRGVLDVYEALLKAGSDVAGVVPLTDIPLPPKPYDIDTNEEARQKWKWAARDAHTANYHRRQDRLSQHALLTMCRRFREEPAIYFPHNLDFRGRAYPVPLVLHPQGSDLVKGLLRFAVGKPLGTDGRYWLAVHGANTFGVDKVSFEDRVQWVEENSERVYSVGIDPLADMWWTEADSPWCFLAFCFEWTALYASENNCDFVSHLPIAMDGSCNGLQHFSAMLRDSIGGAAVNLIPSDKPQDIYQAVADRVMEKLRLIACTSASDGLADVAEMFEPEETHEKKKGPTEAEMQRWAHSWLNFGMDRKITKRPVMVLPYGGTPRSCLKYVEEAVKEKIAAGKDPNLGDELPRAIAWLSKLVWEGIGDVVVAARDAMGWLQKVARLTAKANSPLYWQTPSGFVAYQLYPDLTLRRIKTRINGTIIKLTAYDEADTINNSKQSTSVSPNYTHSMDASAMILTAAKAFLRGITSLAMIHDSYGTHACDTTTLRDILREVFVDMYRNRPLVSFRDQVAAQCPSVADELPELPPEGDLNLEQIKESRFFFA